MKPDAALPVLSCDMSADIWWPFSSLSWKYRVDCPYPVYLGTNCESWGDSRVRMLLFGEEKDRAESTRRVVEQVPTPYLIVTLGDRIQSDGFFAPRTPCRRKYGDDDT